MFFYFAKMLLNPYTGDSGVSPIIIVLIVLSAAIVIGSVIWALLIGKKHDNDITTVEVDDNNLEPNHTVVETIESEITPENDVLTQPEITPENEPESTPFSEE